MGQELRLMLNEGMTCSSKVQKQSYCKQAISTHHSVLLLVENCAHIASCLGQKVAFTSDSVIVTVQTLSD